MSTRNQVRSALLSKSEFRKEVVEYNGIKVEIRQPSVKGRQKILRDATVDGTIDSMEFLTRSVIENTYMVGTDERVFEDADYDVLVNKPTGGFLDKFGEKCAELMNTSIDIEEQVKN